MEDVLADYWRPFGLAMAALAAVALGVLAVILIWGAAQRRRKSPHRVGDEMKNARAQVVEWAEGSGMVRADGELWRAVSLEPLAAGDEVAVTGVDGLTLEVRKRQQTVT
jgi:membrane-bound serine protease (ClpP class)